jgi:DNA-binding response OmpR family regulator
MHPVGGIELLAEIKKRNPVTPVIMITGYPTDETRNECIRLGAGAYMTKPLDLAELEAVINHLVSAPV